MTLSDAAHAAFMFLGIIAAMGATGAILIASFIGLRFLLYGSRLVSTHYENDFNRLVIRVNTAKVPRDGFVVREVSGFDTTDHVHWHTRATPPSKNMEQRAPREMIVMRNESMDYAMEYPERHSDEIG